MKGDFSRISFDAKKHYRAVLMQQGRLQLDSDWNEQVQMMEHRYNAFFQSMVGRSGTPKNDGMKLYVENDELKLSGSVYYIDGLLIENEGLITLDVPPSTGAYLYYIDAWTREVSAAEDGNLIDPAIGLETTTRLKTEWMVRYQNVATSGITETEKEKYKIGDWPELNSGNWWKGLSTGTLKLVSSSEKVDKSDNRVMVDKDDNRLYRIEVHQDDPALPGHIFKWSVDNASICAEITTVDKKLFTLKNNTPDLQNAFKDAAWIELYIPGEPGKSEGLWQRFELSNESGNSFDSNNGKLTLKDSWEKAGGASKTIMRRWDGVFPEEKKNSLALELGVDFEYDKNKFFRHGDYWLVQVRNGKIVNWKAGDIKTPEGVEHHFAALGIMTKVGKSIREPELLSVVFNPLTSPNLSTAIGANIQGSLTVGGDLTVEGVTKLNGPLTANNSATISGVLTAKSTTGNVFGTGSAVSNNVLTVNGATTITGALAAKSTTGNVFGAGSAVSGNVLTVTGAATITGALAAGATTISGILTAQSTIGNIFGTGSAASGNVLTVNGATTITGALAAKSTTGNVFGTGSAASGNLLTVTGATTITGVFAARSTTGNVFGTGNAVSSNVLTVFGDTAINGNFSITGDATAKTPIIGTNSTILATTAFVQNQLTVSAAPRSHVGAGGETHSAATTSVAGFMSASDKVKLNGIVTGAQVNAVTSVAGRTGAITLSVSDVNGAAPLASPNFTGTPKLGGNYFFMHKFYGNVKDNDSTDILVTEWFPCVAGFYVTGDIQENGAGDIMRCYLEASGTTWRIRADFRTHNSGYKFDMRVLFIRRALVSA